MGVILDTTVLIAAEKQRFDLTALFTAQAQNQVFISAITVSELVHGVERATPAHRTKRAQFVEDVLTSIEAIDFDSAVARSHAKVWASLETAGTMIGAHDIIIAATALHFGHSVATLNGRDFKRVAGLQLVDTSPFS
jgi:tRNA(fMet)-specific endonuclease VapC